MFTMRFDMRAMDGPESSRGLYQAALEMASWGEQKGCLAVHVSEHHASPDGYLSAPLILASAMAGRTQTLPIQVAALLVPLHDPIELAEQMAVLDIVSTGRVSYVCALGYRAEEYAMFGRELKGRGRRMEACLEAIKRAWSGEAFEFEGRPVYVTPQPLTRGGPMLLMGGSSPIAVRRAARFGMGMITQGGEPGLEDFYRAECEKAGTTPGLFVHPVGDSPSSCFVAEDPERAWAELGPYLLHDARMYDAWMGDAHSVTRSSAADVHALRAEQGNYRIFTPEEAVERIRTRGLFLTQPLAGGIPPEKAWRSLELLVDRVLPDVGASS